MFAGTDREVVIQETVMTRHGTDRVLRYAFDLATRRDRRHVTSATKSNGIAITIQCGDGALTLTDHEISDFPSVGEIL